MALVAVDALILCFDDGTVFLSAVAGTTQYSKIVFNGMSVLVPQF